jgi:hypothetical protein
MHHANNVGADLIDLTMNASFIGRFEAGLSFQALPFQIGQENVAGLGKEKSGLVGPSAPDQHLIPTVTGAHMAGGLFEESEFGENAARQRHLSR